MTYAQVQLNALNQSLVDGGVNRIRFSDNIVGTPPNAELVKIRDEIIANPVFRSQRPDMAMAVEADRILARLKLDDKYEILTTGGVPCPTIVRKQPDPKQSDEHQGAGTPSGGTASEQKPQPKPRQPGSEAPIEADPEVRDVYLRGTVPKKD